MANCQTGRGESESEGEGEEKNCQTVTEPVEVRGFDVRCSRRVVSCQKRECFNLSSNIGLSPAGGGLRGWKDIRYSC